MHAKPGNPSIKTSQSAAVAGEKPTRRIAQGTEMLLDGNSLQLKKSPGGRIVDIIGADGSGEPPYGANPYAGRSGSIVDVLNNAARIGIGAGASSVAAVALHPRGLQYANTLAVVSGTLGGAMSAVYNSANDPTYSSLTREDAILNNTAQVAAGLFGGALSLYAGQKIGAGIQRYITTRKAKRRENLPAQMEEKFMRNVASYSKMKKLLLPETAVQIQTIVSLKRNDLPEAIWDYIENGAKISKGGAKAGKLRKINKISYGVTPMELDPKKEHAEVRLSTAFFKKDPIRKATLAKQWCPKVAELMLDRGDVIVYFPAHPEKSYRCKLIHLPSETARELNDGSIRRNGNTAVEPFDIRIPNFCPEVVGMGHPKVLESFRASTLVHLKNDKKLPLPHAGILDTLRRAYAGGRTVQEGARTQGVRQG